MTNVNRIFIFHIKKKLWVRIPIIPDVNDSYKEMQMIRDIFEEHGFPEKCELLPYHALGENKYDALNRKAIIFCTLFLQETYLLLLS